MDRDLKTGLVSVIIPTFNAERYIIDTITSVLHQDYEEFEILLADDASTDSTVSICESFIARDSRIRLLASKVNSGAAEARNRALQAARGQYVAFLDADDMWRSDKLSQQLNFMREKECSFSFTAYRVCKWDGAFTGKIVDLKSPERVGYRDMLAKRATLGCSTVMIDQSVVGRLRMPLIRTGQDYALWLSILREGRRACRLPMALTDYRIVPGSISRNKRLKAQRQWKIYRELEGLRLDQSALYFGQYVYHAFFRN